MRKVSFILLFVIGISYVSHGEEPAVKHRVKTWRISDRFATPDTIPVDTLHLNFQQDNHIDRYSIARAYRGNLGSPIESKIFFNRPVPHEFIFTDAYYPYLKSIESAVFYNTTTPFSSIYYLSGGTNYYEDEQIRFLFTANVNKKLNFGTTLDYIYARGEYMNLASKRFAGSLFGTYDGRRYKAIGQLSINNHSNYENGGIQDTMYINGSVNYPPHNIPVNIEGYAELKKNQLFYNHQYSIGIERSIQITEDSSTIEYVPVTIFAHTLQADELQKRYHESDVERDFYENTYLPHTFTNDSASFFNITNRFSVSMAEEFNTWMKFGLTAYIENDIFNYGYLIDTVYTHLNRSNTKLGGVLSKNQGKFFRYKVNGEFNFVGPNAGDFLLNGSLRGYFNFWNQQVQLLANGFVNSKEPSRYMQFYHSNHFRWDNNFDKMYKTQLSGTLAVPTLGFNFNLSVENISNHVYFNRQALPDQFSGNVQVLAADLKQDVHVGKFTLENQLVYQLSSHQHIIPLPDLALYHNLYYHDQWFKVLSMQIGVDMRYHTAYYAPAYMPATGQFYVQDDMVIGNYPVMNVYLNAHLKRTRFFVQYYHVNELFMNGDYYSMPYYPINPATFKMGLTWNFYD